MTEKFKSRKILTPEFRVSFPRVLTPGRNFNDTEDEYSMTMLFDKKTDISEIKKLMQEAVTFRWPDPKTRPKDLKYPVKDGDSVAYDGYPGCWAIRCASRMRPGLVDENVQAIISEDEFYAGCYARASITAYAYAKGNNGVGIGLQNIQKLREGEPFAGRSNPTDDFGPPSDPGVNDPKNYQTGGQDGPAEPWDDDAIPF